MLNWLTMPNILSITKALGVMKMNLPFDEVLARIETADDDETAQIMEAVQKRFSAAFPDWEAIYLSCPKHDGRPGRKHWII